MPLPHATGKREISQDSSLLLGRAVYISLKLEEKLCNTHAGCSKDEEVICTSESLLLVRMSELEMQN